MSVCLSSVILNNQPSPSRWHSIIHLTLGISNYSVTSNRPNMKLVQWRLMGGLLHLIQRGRVWAGPQPVHALPRCTESSECNSPHVNRQCDNIAVYSGPLLWILMWPRVERLLIISTYASVNKHYRQLPAAAADTARPHIIGSTWLVYRVPAKLLIWSQMTCYVIELIQQ